MFLIESRDPIYRSSHDTTELKQNNSVSDKTINSSIAGNINTNASDLNSNSQSIRSRLLEANKSTCNNNNNSPSSSSSLNNSVNVNSWSMGTPSTASNLLIETANNSSVSEELGINGINDKEE